MLKFIAGTHAAVWATIGGIAILAGCKRPDTEVGIDYAQEDLLILQQTDTILIDFATVREDSLETGGGPAGGLSTAVLGNMEHPQFGMHQGGFVTQLRLIEPDFDFGESPVIDSIYLSLRYTGATYGVLVPQNINVFELADTLSADSGYYSNQGFPHLDEALADPTRQPIDLNPGREIYFGDDTLAPQARIYLTNAFGQRLLDAGSDVYDSNQSWNEYFAGIKVVPDASMGGSGAVGIDSSSGMAGVFSGAGLKTRIRFPELDAWEDERDDDRTIHKAELFLPVAPENNDSRYPIPNDLFILTENENGDAISTPDENSIGLNINGNYDDIEQAYRFNISQTFQRLLNGTLASEDFYIVASRGGISLAGVRLNGPQALSESDTTNVTRKARIVVTWSE